MAIFLNRLTTSAISKTPLQHKKIFQTPMRYRLISDYRTIATQSDSRFHSLNNPESPQFT